MLTNIEPDVRDRVYCILYPEEDRMTEDASEEEEENDETEEENVEEEEKEEGDA